VCVIVLDPSVLYYRGVYYSVLY